MRKLDGREVLRLFEQLGAFRLGRADTGQAPIRSTVVAGQPGGPPAVRRPGSGGGGEAAEGPRRPRCPRRRPMRGRSVESVACARETEKTLPPLLLLATLLRFARASDTLDTSCTGALCLDHPCRGLTRL
jgi:hypothetical protein